MAKRKRKDHHRKIIGEADLERFNMKVTQFHTAQKMPRGLRGVPDLHVMFAGMSWWIEIKPRYANYMRDQMSDLQWTWFHERQIHFGRLTRYAIVENAAGIKSVVFDWEKHEPIDLSDYHQGRYEAWRRGR